MICSVGITPADGRVVDVCSLDVDFYVNLVVSCSIVGRHQKESVLFLVSLRMKHLFVFLNEVCLSCISSGVFFNCCDGHSVSLVLGL